MSFKLEQFPHPWDADVFLTKCKLYAANMEKFEPNDWEFGLWSSLLLEHLARAALASYSIVLLADNKVVDNIKFALGLPASSEKFTPKSISISEVFSRLKGLSEEFSKSDQYYLTHISNRNNELHSGDSPFKFKKNSEWLPRYYGVCQVLLKILKCELSTLFSNEPAIQGMLFDFKKDETKEINELVEKYKVIWNEVFTDEERVNRSHEAKMHVSRNAGHRVTCPACNHEALLHGLVTGPIKTNVNYADDELTQKQTVIPNSFECFVCGLKITGHSKLKVVNLAESFTKTSVYTVAEYFELYSEGEFEDWARERHYLQYEPDFNE